MTDNIVDLSLARQELRGLERTFYSPNGCMNHTYLIDPEANTVKCSRCNKDFNLMAVLLDLSNQESIWQMNRRAFIKESEKIEKRRRTKCEHCNKMTRIYV